MRKVFLLKSHLSKRGGAEKYALRLATAFKERNYDVTLVTSGDFQAPEGLTVKSCPENWLSYQFVKKFDQFCQEVTQGQEIVFSLDRNRFQSHLRASNGVHASFLKQRKATDSMFKQFCHPFNPLHRLLLSIEKQSFEDPELKTLVANSNMVKQEILENYHVDEKKIQVVHNGVEWLEMQDEFSAWQKENDSLYHFLFIGHNYERKGLGILLKALALLPNDSFELTVIGKDKNEEHFKKLASGMNVHFMGPRKDIKQFYQKADALVIPSFYDPFANVTVEALAMGLFVVSSNTNGGSEILKEGAVSSLDIDDLKNALEKAMQHPKTKESALKIRNSIAHLDFSNQLTALLDVCGL